ncbi:MAG TPA: dihydrofolate reductase family protein [Dongiaceae bacterium]|jgi:dihydrofolate reductase|nr:dihydrofolate reductase family protein [Dongiaceae bacterium]
MRKLILKMSISADGFVGGPKGEIDWIFKSYDSGATSWTVDTLWNTGVHVMGSRTFKDMAAYWPNSTEPYAPPMNEIPKVVFSRKGTIDMTATTRALEDAIRLRKEGEAAGTPAILSSWTNPTIAAGDLAEEIARLKQEPGKPILAHGGASFARSLVRHGLVDEYRLLVHPVALGRGLPLFSDLPEPLDLKLLSAMAFAGGAVAHVYEPARPR